MLCWTPQTFHTHLWAELWQTSSLTPSGSWRTRSDLGPGSIQRPRSRTLPGLWAAVCRWWDGRMWRWSCLGAGHLKIDVGGTVPPAVERSPVTEWPDLVDQNWGHQQDVGTSPQTREYAGMSDVWPHSSAVECPPPLSREFEQWPSLSKSLGSLWMKPRDEVSLRVEFMNNKTHP